MNFCAQREISWNLIMFHPLGYLISLNVNIFRTVNPKNNTPKETVSTQILPLLKLPPLKVLIQEGDAQWRTYYPLQDVTLKSLDQTRWLNLKISTEMKNDFQGNKQNHCLRWCKSKPPDLNLNPGEIQMYDPISSRYLIAAVSCIATPQTRTEGNPDSYNEKVRVQD